MLLLWCVTVAVGVFGTPSGHWSQDPPLGLLSSMSHWTRVRGAFWSSPFPPWIPGSGWAAITPSVKSRTCLWYSLWDEGRGRATSRAPPTLMTSVSPLHKVGWLHHQAFAKSTTRAMSLGWGLGTRLWFTAHCPVSAVTCKLGWTIDGQVIRGREGWTGKGLNTRNWSEGGREGVQQLTSPHSSSPLFPFPHYLPSLSILCRVFHTTWAHNSSSATWSDVQYNHSNQCRGRRRSVSVALSHPPPLHLLLQASSLEVQWGGKEGEE